MNQCPKRDSGTRHIRGVRLRQRGGINEAIENSLPQKKYQNEGTARSIASLLLPIQSALTEAESIALPGDWPFPWLISSKIARSLSIFVLLRNRLLFAAEEKMRRYLKE